MINHKNLLVFSFTLLCTICFGQTVPILNYSVNSYGQVELEIEAEADKYYSLSAIHPPSLNYESITSITLGVDGNMIISEPLGAFDLQNYKITEHSIASPDDLDNDGINDMVEFNDMPSQAPLNFGNEVPFIDGSLSIPNADVYSQLAVIDDNIPWAPFLNNQEFAKFAILNQNTDEPEVYFINSNTHYIHADFLATINTTGADVVTGEVVFNPNEILPNGAIGSYSFNYSFGNSYTFEHTRRTFELLAANMPYLNNNLQHFIGAQGENQYLNVYKDDYEGSRLNVVLESEVFADVDFIPFHQAEGFGFFRAMQLDENPGSRDIVLYDALPNSLPRVGGIITSVVQTPLSHVNLRAIQDNVPNAYIKEPLEIDSIANLIGKYIYYKVEQDNYHIREATLDEVNEWFEKLRPTEEQIPDRDLSQTEILPLDEIDFGMSNAFGAKCTNVATMRTFGFPENTIPDGFGIPFYYYDEFMKYNGFYDSVQVMLANPDFHTDLELRIDVLKEFRRTIKDADLPQWMLDDLQAMHDAFPEGTNVRVRSSTNNEDLPGFSGAGLYTSKTQYLDEGHISKSVKQVYASMWNFRAYEERDFYRVDHYVAAMGLLCHPNYQEEKSNGVGISLDPIYQTEATFYLNTQVGESLITNPDANSIPEEILLSQDPVEGYFVLRNSNLVPDGELVMDEGYLNLMRDYLKVIHDEFEILYDVVGAEGFGMDIEYKVTAQDQLIIKQARPWVSFWAEINATFDLAVQEIVDPQSAANLSNAQLIIAQVGNEGLKKMSDFDLSLYVDNQFVETLEIGDELSPQSSAEYQFTVPQDFSVIGDYNVEIIVQHQEDGYSKNDTLTSVISHLHLLEGSLEAQFDSAGCGEELHVLAFVTNYGEETFSDTKIEVTVNGMVVDLITYDYSIPYLATVEIPIVITDNLQSTENEISLELKEVNGQQDAIVDNNSATIEASLDNSFNEITFIINADNYPEETSWQLYDENNAEIVASGSMVNGQVQSVENICVDYNSCFSLTVFDSYGDGICCSYGSGNFLMLNFAGETIFVNDGEFETEVTEIFCPGDGCLLSAEINTTLASSETTADGSISINPSNGETPYQYSIDGGITFVGSSFFTGLLPGTYMIVVRDASDNCVYEETIELGFEIMSSTSQAQEALFKIYPNPTRDAITIETQSFISTNTIQIAVYNNLGKVVLRDQIEVSGESSSKNISFVDFEAGTYFVRCYNELNEKTYKIIRL